MKVISSEFGHSIWCKKDGLLHSEEFANEYLSYFDRVPMYDRQTETARDKQKCHNI